MLCEYISFNSIFNIFADSQCVVGGLFFLYTCDLCLNTDFLIGNVEKSIQIVKYKIYCI